MSTQRDVEVACPRCGFAEKRRIAVSVNVGRSPGFREDLLRERFHRFFCGECLQTFNVDVELNWIDFGRSQWLRVFPLAMQARWVELAGESQRTYEQYLVGEKAPSIARQMGKDMVVRTVFGLIALREKLLCWQSGLDDRVFAVLQLAVWRDSGGLEPSEIPRLLGTSSESLELASPVTKRSWSVPISDYHECAAQFSKEVELQDLLSGPFVDPVVLVA